MAPYAGVLQRTQAFSHSRTCSSSEASCSGRALPSFAAPQMCLKQHSALKAALPVCRRQQPGLAASRGCQLGGTTVCEAGTFEQAQGRGEFSNQMTVPTTAMAKLGGSGGGVTIERTKLNLSQKVQTVEPKLSNDGGGGGLGNKIFNGGGGDGDDGDDDDYFNFEDGDGDGEDGFWRTAVKELYDEVSINAVLQEWFRTVADLPLIIRQSVQLGLFSSAQLVRFLSMDVRPNITRSVTRVLPPQVARGVVGRLMADPAFMQKLIIEEAATAALSIYYEMQQRGENFTRELDFVALNTLSMMAATGAMVWLVAPNRSYGAVHKFPWQNVLHNLPNHVFDSSTPYRRFSIGSRVGSLFAKAAEMSGVGLLLGAAQSLGGQGLVKLHQSRNKDFKPSLAVPDLSRSTGGLAAYTGTIANARYQLVGGLDRFMFDKLNVLPIYLLFSAVARSGLQACGQSTRLFSQGMPTAAPYRAPKPVMVKKVVRRKIKKRPAKAPAAPEDIEMSAQMLRWQQQQREARGHAMA